MKYTYQHLEDEWTTGYWNFIQNNLDKELGIVITESKYNMVYQDQLV